MRLMDEEVEGMMVEVEGTVEEVDVKLVSAIVGPWDRGCSDTMKRFNPSFINCTNGVHTVMRKKLLTQKEKREKFGNKRKRKFWWKRNDLLNYSLQWSTIYIYIYIYIHKDQLWPY